MVFIELKADQNYKNMTTLTQYKIPKNVHRKITYTSGAFKLTSFGIPILKQNL